MMAEEEDEDVVTMLGKRRYCCCWIPWSASRSPPQSSEWWAQIQMAERGDQDQPSGRRHRPWYAPGLRALLKLREWSELIAGPRWKTFIRRFNHSPSRRHATGASRFGYDPLSYALNFDGGDEDGGEDHAATRSFSARFVDPAAGGSAKPSMDLGGADPPPLFAGGGGK